VKLRGRFTVTLAFAALVPISLAAVITTRSYANKLHTDYIGKREQAAAVVNRELGQLGKSVRDAATALANRDHPFVGALLIDLGNSSGTPSRDEERRLREQEIPTMKGLSLDILTVTGPDDIVIVSPHYRGKINDPNPLPVMRQRAEASGGTPFYTRDSIWTGHTAENVLVIESAQVARDAHDSVVVVAGKRVTDDLLSLVRGDATDARIVLPSGEVLFPPKGGDAEWAKLAKDPPIRTAMPGADGKAVAYIEVAISDGGLDHLLLNNILTAALLALGALAVVVLVGSLVARRTARDLDQLVEGSIAAARGDLEYRVPVRDKDEVGAVANAFNFMMEDLKVSKEKLVIAERIAAWQEIARRLAHEIKNPLTPIQMAMDTLRKSYKKQHPEFAEILEESTTTVLEEADRLKRIVAEFSDFARMPKPEFGRVDLNDVIRSSLALYKDATPQVEAKLDKQLPDLDADKGQLSQVLLNLVENGRDVLGARPNGRVTVTTKRGEGPDRLTLVVEDNGPGVPSELKDKVFAPYFTTKLAKGGTGLGLAIVHRIISDHGGRIVITDAPGGGARFTIELPLRNGQALLASRI
jgi:two-component system, NtrC family, nitrogen regulation sensor histidine kinase NtrY